MTTVTVNIPEKELDFFLKLMQKFKLETVVTTNYEISDVVKKEMIHRKNTATSDDYINAKGSLLSLRKKYGV